MAGMRAVFNLDISLGLFGFSTKGYKALNDPSEGVSFRQIHGACATPIYQVKRCKTCEVDVPFGDLAKGIEASPGQFLAFADEEIKALKPANDGSLSIDGYMDATEIDAAYHNGSTYLLAPAAKKDYTTFTTFREALGTRWAVGKTVLYGRERVVAIRAVDAVLGLHVIRAHNEIRNPVDVPSYDKIPTAAKADYVALMDELMQAKVLRLDDVAFDSDSYADAVTALIAARLAGAPNPTPATAAPVVPTDDLMAMLKASLATAKKAA